MKLTRYTDYAMRNLIHLGAHEDRLCSIPEIARAYKISQSHLMKVVQDLVAAGYVDSVRGRHGGIRLNRRPGDINLGAVVRHTECGFELVDCANCAVRSACSLPGILAEATRAFIGVLDRYSLADLVRRPADIKLLLGEAVA